MEKQEIVKLFLDKGLQLDPSSLEYLYTHQDNITFVLNNLIGKSIGVVTLDLIKSVLPEDVVVIKEFKEEPRKVSVDDLVKMLRKRYENISEILLKRLDLVNLISIGKITKKSKKFSLICLVRDKNPDKRSLLVEDGSGEVEVFFTEDLEDFKFIVLDEVVGLVCETVNDMIFVRKVVFPDIPFKKEISRTEEEVFCLFLSDFCLDSGFNEKYFQKFLDWLKEQKEKNILIFVLGGISSKESDVEEIFKILSSFKDVYLLKSEKDASSSKFKFEDPVLVKVKGLTLLLSHGNIFQKYAKLFGLPIEQTCLLMLKKRHLNPTIELGRTFEDVYFLDAVPDIVACGSSNQPSFLNYKNTTILSCGNFVDKPIFWMVNLKSREIFKIDLS
jgi:DNA polymerase II small subunit/DNA polymerase delta subunit B